MLALAQSLMLASSDFSLGEIVRIAFYLLVFAVVIGALLFAVSYAVGKGVCPAKGGAVIQVIIVVLAIFALIAGVLRYTGNW